MLNPISFENFMTNISKIVKRNIYSRFTRTFSGWFSKENLGWSYSKEVSKLKKNIKYLINRLTKKLLEPVISAILLVQNLYAEKD